MKNLVTVQVIEGDEQDIKSFIQAWGLEEDFSHLGKDVYNIPVPGFMVEGLVNKRRLSWFGRRIKFRAVMPR